jgi:exopolysaccharide production protein ExoQ
MSEPNTPLHFVRQPDHQLTLLLVVAVLFGGGGSAFGMFNLIVQLCAIALLAANPSATAAFFRQAPGGLRVLVLATLALPLLHLVPLPPAVWRALPGRELVSESLDLLGRADAWFPMSVAFNRTATAFLALLPPLAVLVLAWQLDQARLRRIVWRVVLLALFCVALGAVQLVSGNAAGNLYPNARPELLYGTFANRNSTGLFLVIALTCVAGLWSKDRAQRFSWFVFPALALTLTVGVLLTQSRSSVTLLLVPLALFALRLLSFRAGGTSSSSRVRIAVVSAVVLAGLAGGYALFTSAKVQQTVGRFADLEDQRPQIWEDGLVSAGRYWPAGSGMGTFDEVFQVDESLEYVDARRAGRAHNDYLELAIEAGLAGLLLLACWFGWVLFRAASPGAGRARGLSLAGAASLAAIALQSILDYPLRNQAILCIAATMIVLVMCKEVAEKRGRRSNGE